MLRCLIVDDSLRFLDAARGLLERQGVTLELARRLHQAGRAPAPMILISTHAELIAASPAIGFLPKTSLSADAIRDLLAGRGDGARP